MRLPLTVHWWPPPTLGRTRFVVFAYHAADRDAVATLWSRLESLAARTHRILHRDHYANPRSLQYQLALVAEAAEHLSPGMPTDLVIDRRFGDAATVLPESAAHAIFADPLDCTEWMRGVLADSRRYDHLVLVYADALGLGCGAAERLALRGRDSVLIINGRRRAFRMTSRFRRRMQLSRYLAHTRIMERALAIAVRPVAAALAAYDRTPRRQPVE